MQRLKTFVAKIIIQKETLLLRCACKSKKRNSIILHFKAVGDMGQKWKAH